MVACAVAGAVCTGVPFLLDHDHPRSVAGSTLTNLGTGLFLAAVLFLLERTFVSSVRTVVTTAATRAANEATADLRRTTEELTTRLDELQDLTRQRVDARAQGQDNVIGRLRDEVSSRRVAEALAVANSLEALSGGTVRVPAGPSASSPRFRFSYGTHLPGSLRPPGTLLEVEFVVERVPEPGGVGKPVIEAGWAFQMTADDLTASMDAELRRRGFAPEADAVQWPVLFERLRYAIEAAVAARRHDEDAWLSAPLIELVDVGWAVTDAGLEVEGHGLVLSSDAFPDRPSPYQPKPDFSPPPPAWADPDVWAVAIRRAYERHPMGPRIPGYAPTWLPALSVNA